MNKRCRYQHRGETLGLAMSRSLGDAIVHKCGVSAEPEVLEHQVDEMDEFIIIATDGVWDVVDNAHAAQMVQNVISKAGDLLSLYYILILSVIIRNNHSNFIYFNETSV